MTDSEQHPYVELIAREARRPVITDPAARARIMAAVRAEPALKQRPHLWERMLEPRSLRLSPVVATLLAASLVGIGVFGSTLVHNRDARSSSGGSTASVAPTQLPVSDTVVRFVFIAPRGATNVSLVGDFNQWDSTKTPMSRGAIDGEWTVTLPLSQGRHLYSFVVDGAWSADPTAPLAPDDGFGHANSVKLVRRGSAL
jgi:hypothetical protein